MLHFSWLHTTLRRSDPSSQVPTRPLRTDEKAKSNSGQYPGQTALRRNPTSEKPQVRPWTVEIAHRNIRYRVIV